MVKAGIDKDKITYIPNFVSKEMFYNILEKNMIPVYDSARRQGYEIWDYS